MNIVKAQRAKWLRQAQQNQRRSLFPVHFFTFHFFTSSLLHFSAGWFREPDHIQRGGLVQTTDSVDL